jgi:hypothetical protein
MKTFTAWLKKNEASWQHTMLPNRNFKIGDLVAYHSPNSGDRFGVVKAVYGSSIGDEGEIELEIVFMDQPNDWKKAILALAEKNDAKFANVVAEKQLRANNVTSKKGNVVELSKNGDYDEIDRLTQVPVRDHIRNLNKPIEPHSNAYIEPPTGG